MIDFVAGATANVAPANEPTGASPAPSADGACSFAELLDAASDDVTDAAPADENDEESGVNEWMTIPVFVPVVPVVPIEHVVEDPVATSVDGMNADDRSIDAVDVSIDARDVSIDSSAAVLEDVSPIPLSTFPDGGAQPPMERKDQAKPASSEPLTPAPPVSDASPGHVPVQTVSLPVVSRQPSPGATDVLRAVPAAPEATTSSEGETTFSLNTTQVDVQRPATSPGKVAAPTASTNLSNVNEETKPAANEISNVASSLVQSGTELTQVVAAPDRANGVESGSRGLAARLARALEHAVQSSTPTQTAGGGGEKGFSFNSHSDSQPSVGEWLREQLLQAVAGRAHAVLSPAFSVAAPLQAEGQAYGVVAAAGQSLTAPAASLPNEHDVTLQLVQSMRMQFRDGIGEAVLTLKPEHLGSVSISLRVENGGIKASVQADVPAVRQWLESQQDTLRSALAEQGLRLDRFDVEPDARRQTAEDDVQERAQRRRAARKPRQGDEPIFEVVV